MRTCEPCPLRCESQTWSWVRPAPPTPTLGFSVFVYFGVTSRWLPPTCTRVSGIFDDFTTELSNLQFYASNEARRVLIVFP